MSDNLTGRLIDPAHPLNRGLVSYWVCSEGAGLRANDIVDTRNFATLNNGAAWSAGKNGSAIKFDGADDDASMIPYIPNLFNSTDFSLSFWVFPLTQSGNLKCIMDYSHAVSGFGSWVVQSEDANTNRYYYLTYNSGNSSTPTFQPVGGIGVGSGVQITNGEWQQIVYSKTGTAVRGYKNGVLVWSPPAASSSNVFYQSTRALMFGGGVSYGGIRNFAGSINDVRIYNRGLSASEVSQLYVQTQGFNDTTFLQPTRRILQTANVFFAYVGRFF